MSIFGSLFGKKDDKARGGCCGARIADERSCDCGGASASASESASSADGGTLVVKVMGTGCKKCHQLHDNALEAAKRIGGGVEVEYVTDIAEIAAAGVISTPALLIDGKIASSGKVASPDEIEKMLR